MNRKAEKLLFRYVTEGVNCPTCQGKFTVTPGTINEKPAWIISCSKGHKWQMLVTFQGLEEAEKPAEVAPVVG